MSDTSHHRRDSTRGVSLSAIIAGTIVSLGLMVMFTLLGLAIGVASLEAVGQGLGLGAAIYIVVTQLISLAAGGFAASRFMDPTDTLAAGLAGAAVWALTTLAVAFGGLATGTSALSSSTSLVAQTAQAGANAAQAVTPESLALPDIGEIAGSISISDLPPQLQQTLQEADVTPDQLRSEAREAFRNVISQQEQSRARSIITGTLSDVAAQPGSLAEEVNAALDRLVGGENAVVSEEDLNAATGTLQQRLDISDSEARQIVDAVQARFQQAVETLRQTAQDVQAQLVETANNVQGAVASAATWLFIASLLGLAAAAAAGAAGRVVRRV